MVPRENENNDYVKFGGTNKEYDGIFRNGLSCMFPARERLLRMLHSQNPRDLD